MNIGVIGAGKFGIIANQLSLNKKNKVIVLSRSSKKLIQSIVNKKLIFILIIYLKI